MTRTDITLVKQHFVGKDPKVAAILATVDLSDWFEERVPEDHFFNLSREIIYQQLAGKAASAIFSRFEKLVGGKVKPDKVIKIPDQTLRDVGLSWAKARYVKDLAAKALSGEVALTNLHELDDEAVIAELTKVKGIGRWTAEMFLLFGLKRLDVLAVGDAGLQRAARNLYGKKRKSETLLPRVAENWRPYRSIASWYLWRSLESS